MISKTLKLVAVALACVGLVAADTTFPSPPPPGPNPLPDPTQLPIDPSNCVLYTCNPPVGPLLPAGS